MIIPLVTVNFKVQEELKFMTTSHGDTVNAKGHLLVHVLSPLSALMTFMLIYGSLLGRVVETDMAYGEEACGALQPSVINWLQRALQLSIINF